MPKNYLSTLLHTNNIKAPELIPGGKWFNLSTGSRSLTLKELRGKVIMVDFWTYTCVNCIRTLPYLCNWDKKYKDKGLVIIGVHTPEFEFEKNPENVKKAIADFDLKYPTMQDNAYATWQAYNNHYWPAKYLVDKDGVIRYTHFGEGDYDETEEVIQKLLRDAGQIIHDPIDNPTYDIKSRTPELYIGYSRMGYFTSGDQIALNTKKVYKFPDQIALHHFAFAGNWLIENERSTAYPGAALTLAFEALKVFLVMKPFAKPKGSKSKVQVYLDSKLLKGGEMGKDVKEGLVLVDKDKLYELINLHNPGQHTLKLIFIDNTQLYAFTFG
ncbi:hypothetical protein A3A76_05665 [Candidatus Woesebacteria bacterium RIFCSPLOWO2_01_FULL_39_23]|uniref:Thioredoxin domain-containing protein n=1 Tax=Candidatus Woesebacteria bacterium RIFCSPHIGHO2_01_FULL_40_22 TaxID=1802499 RepID=A0A1F7YKY1_9BACT|nr:MAG: hypothetical protein A2141_03645 [Candidatus Woesebacteria bacterium RBG_16_40_11]OGM27942.1 MAG: hypothetical protein A2628_03590 [Candidatus Woesebacteria bacterium RIFCSPHIGHO2_01_FULL_40_22]OGM37546.1 MAG: hypothetical protein A3E41_01815 [Candidatus Woesebacteria bacterium RIFCSPHIGHO2_12_FULL_38_9]OGM61698.1 MAG: hypothetical protein A3A76_05665 [Candidatus Woesebacteria bacterium RIFCSPLOWO2_01_FULL_39_23]